MRSSKTAATERYHQAESLFDFDQAFEEAEDLYGDPLAGSLSKVGDPFRR